MNFDINNTINDMLAAIKGTVSDHWEHVKETAMQFLQNEKERLEMIAQLRISGDLNQEDFESRLKDSQKIMEAELEALAVLSKAIIQKAANAAIDVLSKAVKAALPI